MSWTISENLKTTSSGDLVNIVKQATYRYTATSGTASAYYEKVAEFGYDEENFTPFESLTEIQVIGWVQDQLGATFVSQIEQRVSDELAYEVEVAGDIGQTTFVDFECSDELGLDTPNNPW